MLVLVKLGAEAGPLQRRVPARGCPPRWKYVSVAAILLLPMRTVQLHQGSLHTCHVGHDAAVTTLCNGWREGKIQTREREKCRVKESYSRPGFCGPGQKGRQVHPANGTTLGNYPRGKNGTEQKDNAGTCLAP